MSAPSVIFIIYKNEKNYFSFFNSDNRHPWREIIEGENKMKNRTKIIFIITAVLLVLIFAACDSLIAPIKGRNNPLDVMNPVPAPTDFTVRLLDYDQNNRITDITWSEGTSEAESISLEGYIIIRKTLEAPQSIYDGTLVALKLASENKVVSEDTVDVGGGEYPVGNRVYYSIFSYGKKSEDLNESEFLKLNEGILENVGNYNFTGPVSSSVIVTTSVILGVADDGFIDSNENWYNGDQFIYLSGMGAAAPAPFPPGVPTIGFINFDINEIIGVKVVNAELRLTTFAPNSGSPMLDISPLKFDWHNESWVNLDQLSAVHESYTISLSSSQIPNGAPEEILLDVKSIVDGWCTADIDVNGLRLTEENAAAEYCSFQSSEYPGDKPELRVTYYNE
ncbi:MAG TPA: hypothetical protein DCO79_09470 [Spirochaeta sp.]|nr:hypothetical protein [Spirochaeta sp.]